MTLLTVSAVSWKGEGDFALKPTSFLQRRLQRIAIAGETGSGKSTLLKIIAGLVQPDAGEVSFDGEKVMERLVPGHPGIAYLSQNFELPKFLRVEQVLAYANDLSAETAADLYKVCQIDHLLMRRTDQLSGGEKQRIALARLLTTSPKLLLLDEPFSHLDIPHKNTLKAVIRDIGEKLRITCILVSHEPSDILSWADKILVMRDGAVVQTGKPEKIYRQPVDTYVAGLFGKFNLLSPQVRALLNITSNPRRQNTGIIVRPEDLRLSRKGKKSSAGRIQEVNFLGSHYEVTVALGHSTLRIRTSDSSFEPNDKVFVSAARGSGWQLKLI
jgi:iron(III) transport system ATP-binding protein